MELVPLIYIKNGKILAGKDRGVFSIDALFKRVEKDAKLYVLDFDGIDHYNANFDLYQKLTEHCILWIDNGPRRIDDVMDTIMAGATTITVRTEFWPEADIPGILEITDDEIYLAVTPEHKEQTRNLLLSYESLGAVVFGEEKTEQTASYAHVFNNPALKHKMYLYNTPHMNVSYWEQRGVTGMLVDLDKKEGDA
jgi:hypothetical protein